MTKKVLMIGDVVRVVIPSKFTVNGSGAPIPLANRTRGVLVEWNQYDTAEVLWPDGETYSYEPALLEVID